MENLMMQITEFLVRFISLDYDGCFGISKE